MNHEEFDDDQDDGHLPKSKSRIKREMIALQELGERLVSLRSDQLNSLNLPPLLLQAILEAKKIASRGAKRRQLQYIGRLMRDVENPDAISDYLEKLTMQSQKAAAYHHMLEAWRDKLISEDNNTVVTEFISFYSNVDRQHLRQLISNARKERKFGKPVGASRLLFRYIRDLHEEKERGEDNG